MSEKFSKTCPNCFADKVNGGVCSACGFELKKAKRNPNALPDFTVLNERYLTGRIIGAGGFGVTYKVYDFMSNRIMALKEYVPLGIAVRMEDQKNLVETGDDKRGFFVHGKKRFYEEAKALYACSDIPEVVRIFDYFQENNTVYFVMEYIEGMTLRKYLNAKGKKLSLPIALEIVTAAGNALEKVHDKAELFHRDISPENIMIDKEGKVKIIDFGSAKNIDREKQNLSVVLKPGFAPPEQYSSQSKQGRFTDVYALAGTFYYMLTGVMIPVAPERLTGTEYVRLKDMNIGINDTISDAVDKALELKYQNRYQTMGEFLADLGTTLMPDKQWKTENITEHPSENPEHKVISAHTGDDQRGHAGESVRHLVNVAYIEVVGGDMKGSRWNLNPGVNIRLGRSRKSDIMVSNNPEVSRPHFELEYDMRNDQFFIRDLSTNGTSVNGYELQRNKKYIIQKDSIIVLGANACIIKLGVDYE